MLRDRAAAVLRGNDAGSWTKASPHLYPHQWSWDSAFNAIGWAHLDARRAMAELEALFAAQWSTGLVPHIVFRAGPEEPYFPGPEWWDCASAPAAPAPPLQTTGICQPPVHALALQRIWQLTPEPQRPEIRAPPAGALPAPGPMASLSRHGAGPRGIGTGHRLPPMGGHGQLPALGPGPGAHQGGRARPVHPPGHQ